MRLVAAWLLAFVIGVACGPAAAQSAGATATEETPTASKFFDPDDGWFDVSGFLDTAYGFVPVAVPITEPAVGYGAAGALVFIDRDPAAAGLRYRRPNIAVAGGLKTENGTRGLFAGHLGTWMDDRVRTLVGAVDADVNLDFFGLGGDRVPSDTGIGYGIGLRGATAGASYRLGDTALWLGLQYGLAKTNVAVDRPDSGRPGIAPEDRDLTLAALVPSIIFDARDNFFTPTRGWYVDLSVPIFREALGSDRAFERPALTAMAYQPLGSTLYFAVRGAAKSSSDGTPFYLRPFVTLRGVQAMKYQGDQAAEAEVELRWQFHPRFSVVGFGGVGTARADATLADRNKTVTAGGAGFRYLLARAYGLHMGIDVGFGPDKPIIYVVFGSAWLRP